MLLLTPTLPPNEAAQLKIITALTSVSLNVANILIAWRFCLVFLRQSSQSDSLKNKVLSPPASEKIASLPPEGIRRKGVSDLYICNLIKGFIRNWVRQNFRLAQCTAVTFLRSEIAWVPQINVTNPPATISQIQSWVSLWFSFLITFQLHKKLNCSPWTHTN